LVVLSAQIQPVKTTVYVENKVGQECPKPLCVWTDRR
jgi:hypothetical protein